MPIIEITSLKNRELEIYTSLTDAQLRQNYETENGIFIAESPKVIKIALNAGYKPLSLLCEQKHIIGDAAEIISQNKDLTIYTGSREILQNITGYTLTRGVLCAMQRPKFKTVEEICHNASRIVVIDTVSDASNVGAIFRSAAALGIDAILLTPTTCDALNRRAIRVSMGTVFQIKWTYFSGNLNELNGIGFKTAAMALTDNSISIKNSRLKQEKRLSLGVGSEGYGLSQKTINSADYTVKIPMHNNVDSLNVAAASAIAFWELCKNND